MRVGPAEIKVVSNGERKIEHPHQGRTYLEAREGEEYMLRVRNTGRNTICVLATVDGLSVMDGEEASALKADGYVVYAYQSFDIPGWRLNNNEVAKFVFGSIPASYAEKSGKGGNQGVIGLACWQEKKRKPVRTEGIVRERRYRGGGASGQSLGFSGERSTPISEIQCNAAGAARSMDYLSYHEDCASEVQTRGMVDMEHKGDMGTQFGDKAEHRVTTVTFEEEPGSLVKAAFYYASKEALIKRGIDLVPKVSEAADPFPADGQRGCQPPSGWSG